MYNKEDLFEMKENGQTRYLFPTNRRNLLSIFSSAMLGMKDIYAKYRDDILSVSKGYLPLFMNSISHKVIELTTSNPDTNFPVLIELKYDKISTIPMKGLSKTGELLNEGDADIDKVLKLCDAVLSFDMINTVHFRSVEELEDFSSKMFENVPVENYILKVSPQLFDNDIEFEPSWFNDLTETIDNTLKVEHCAAVADKLIASIALLSKNMQKSDDAILLRSLIERTRIPQETAVYPEFTSLTALIDTILSKKTALEDEEENIQLLRILLDRLINTDPSEGWNPIEILDDIYSSYLNNNKDKDNQHIEQWYRFCRAVLKNEKDIVTEAFTDDHDIIKRAIFFFLLRPEYDDIISSENSYLNPGHIIRTLSLFLSGFRTGYERLSNEFKSPKEYHKIFSLLKTSIINKGIDKDSYVVAINTNFDASCDVKDKEYLCKMSISDHTFVENKIDIPDNVHDIIIKMGEKEYNETKYDIFDGRISYSFNYIADKRKQPVFIDIEKHIIKVSSPCVDFTKYKSYEKKYATNKVLAQMMKDNSTMQGKAYYVYEEGVHLRLERRVAISNIKNVDIIDIIEFVAKTADDFEKIYFKHDKVQ